MYIDEGNVVVVFQFVREFLPFFTLNILLVCYHVSSGLEETYEQGANYYSNFEKIAHICLLPHSFFGRLILGFPTGI